MATEKLCRCSFISESIEDRFAARVRITIHEYDWVGKEPLGVFYPYRGVTIHVTGVDATGEQA